AFLTSIDNKVQHLTRKKQLLEQYKKGCMEQIFSQNIRFKDVNKQHTQWKFKRLKEIGQFFSGGTPLTSKKEYYGGGIIPFIKSGEINSNQTEQCITELGLKNSSAKLVNVGDVLYALYGATSGQVSIARISGAINQAILCIRSNQNHLFIYYFLMFEKHKIIQTFLQGGQGNLSAEIIKSLEIPIPSQEEQKKIANFLSAIDIKINLVETQLKKTQEFKKGLLQQMFI
ncbi:MAG: restriction endonuclease subunit S, partial [Segetibacter sp.]